MVKYELDNFCKQFNDEIGFIIQLDGATREFTGVVDAKYYIDEHGNGHVVLIPAIELTPKWE